MPAEFVVNLVHPRVHYPGVIPVLGTQDVHKQLHRGPVRLPVHPRGPAGPIERAAPDWLFSMGNHRPADCASVAIASAKIWRPQGTKDPPVWGRRRAWDPSTTRPKVGGRSAGALMSGGDSGASVLEKRPERSSYVALVPISVLKTASLVSLLARPHYLLAPAHRPRPHAEAHDGEGCLRDRGFGPGEGGRRKQPWLR